MSEPAEPLVVIGRHPDAPSARAASRQLLAAGITPEVGRDGDQHVLRVPATDEARARAVLAGDAPDPAPATPEPVATAPQPTPAAPDEPAPAEATPPATAANTSPASGPPPARVPSLPTAPPPPGAAPAAAVPMPEPAPPVAAEVDDEGFVVVAVADDGDEARDLAARLVERGIGAQPTPAAGTGWDVAGGVPATAVLVRVLAADADRAERVLGVTRPDPPAAPGAGPGEAPPDGAAGPRSSPSWDPDEKRSYLGGRLELTRRQLVGLIVGYLVALVLLPLAFYWGTRWVLSPDVSTPDELNSQFEVPGAP